jgi:hypothetical protein
MQVLTLGHNHNVAVWPAGAPPRGAVSLSCRRQPTIAARRKSTSIIIFTTTIVVVVIIITSATPHPHLHHMRKEQTAVLYHSVVYFSFSPVYSPVFIFIFFSLS